MLRARATDILGWEQFWLGSNPSNDGTWFIESDANGLDVSGEFGYGGDLYGMLRARADSIFTWEKWYLWDLGGGSIAFQSYYPITDPYCCYVSTELGYSGDFQNMLRARARAIGPWEVYSLTALSASPLAVTTVKAQAVKTPTGMVQAVKTPTGKTVACPRAVSQCHLLVPKDPTAASRSTWNP